MSEDQPRISQTTAAPLFLGREHKHVGPVLLDYDRGEFWIHGFDRAGQKVSAPFMKQRDGEELDEFIERVKGVEAAIP